MAFVNEKMPDGTWQTIDREKNVVLTYKGAIGSGAPYKFLLTSPDGEVEFLASRQMKKTLRNLDEVTWNIVKIYIPSTLSAKKAEIFNYIRCSLNEFGAVSRKKGIEKVNVNFNISQL